MDTNKRDRLITDGLGKKHENGISEKLKQLNHQHQIDFLPADTKLDHRKMIDAGAFGVVDLVRYEKKLYAHKHAKTNSYEQQQSILNEAIRLAQISGTHPNIPKIHFVHLKTYGYLMDYYDCSSLDRFLQDPNSTYTLRDAINWSYQLADALSFLHSQNLMHRDVKLANLLLKDNYQALILTDYGTATNLGRSLLTCQAGTPITMAPEVCDTTQYTEHCDIYSWAIVFWQLLSKQTMPYDEKINSYSIMLRVSLEKLRPSQLKPCPEIFLTLLYRSWHSNPFERPSLDFIKKVLRLFLFRLPQTSYQYLIGTPTDVQPLISFDKYQPSQPRTQIERSINLYNEHCQKLRQIAKLKQTIQSKETDLESYQTKNDDQFDRLQELNEENQHLRNEINRLKHQYQR